MSGPAPTIPIVDLDRGDAAAADLGRACRESGFFYVTGHGVDEGLAVRLEQLARTFFAQDRETKMAIRMARGGRAWRGYFPLGDELTAGRPDRKEGLYFGAELADDHPRVAAGVPLHGRNLFPDVPGLRETVLAYLAALTGLGHRLAELVSLSLDLDRNYFADHYTADPLVLFRIFHYPPSPPVPDGAEADWGVGEHTDYGLLTILRQDTVGGLQVRTRSGWIDAPPVPGSFVCNIGDMLDRITGGLYRSTPHRVRNVSDRSRLSLPFFFDPGFDADVRPLPLVHRVEDDRGQRWDQASVHEFRGTYGDYVLRKVAHVFPDLYGESVTDS